MSFSDMIDMHLRLARSSDGFSRINYAEEAAKGAKRSKRISDEQREQILRETQELIRRGYWEEASSSLIELRGWKREFDWSPNHLSRDFYIEWIEKARDRGGLSYQELGTSEEEIARFWRFHNIQDTLRTLKHARTWTSEKGRHWLSRADLLGLLERELGKTKLTPEDIGTSRGEIDVLQKLAGLEDIVKGLEFTLSDDFFDPEWRDPNKDPYEEQAEDIAEYRQRLHSITAVPDDMKTGEQLSSFLRQRLNEELVAYLQKYGAFHEQALKEEAEREEYRESLHRRIDQDINFVVGAVKCRMQLDTTAPGPDDRWIIYPKGITAPDASEAAKHFGSRIFDALCLLLGDSDGLPRNTRRNYDFQIFDDHAILIVAGGSEPLNAAYGIFASMPDEWAGEDLNFRSSERLIDLLKDWKEGMPSIEFFRGDGTPIGIPVWDSLVRAE